MALHEAAGRLRRAAQDPVGIYLNDHLAGATAGLELARRVARSGQLPGDDGAWHRLAGELAEDRRALLGFMAALGIPARGYKVWAAWLGEKAGRLKPNGHVLARSALSSLEELEILRLGVEGKAAGWRTLRELAGRDQRITAGQLDELGRRAERQAAFLEESRVRAARQVIAASGITGG
jgi:hypothetical protein